MVNTVTLRNPVEDFTTMESLGSLEWREFDRMMMECEWLESINKLPRFMVKVLKRHKLWRGEAPYCSWNQFTYELTTFQLQDLVSAYNSFKN